MTVYALQDQLTLLEQARRHDPHGNTAAIAEVLSQTNEIISRMPFIPANDTFANKTTRRASLPSGQFRLINGGVSAEASATVEVWDTIGLLEGYSDIDVELVDNAADPRQFRAHEDAAYIEGMGQTWAQTAFYGNALVDTERFTGLAPRLASLSQKNTYSCGGSGEDLTSVYLLVPGPTKVAFIHPKHSRSVGIEGRDLGEKTLEDATGKRHQVYRTHFRFKCGLMVRDERFIARVANIETSGTSNNLTTETGVGVLMEALNKMPGAGAGAVLCANNTALHQLDVNAVFKENVQYSGTDPFGRPLRTFRGHSVWLCEGILDTETALS